MIHIERVYRQANYEDDKRFLVDRLWPRGIKKDELCYDAWLKDVAPSYGLRLWFKHDPNKWNEFKHRYFNELDQKPEAWRPILDAARNNNITLLYSAKDETHNNAAALKEYLESKL
jgi:uncharacterized protein YeaO (DUF488 family)